MAVEVGIFSVENRTLLRFRGSPTVCSRFPCDDPEEGTRPVLCPAALAVGVCDLEVEEEPSLEFFLYGLKRAKNLSIGNLFCFPKELWAKSGLNRRQRKPSDRLHQMIK